MSLTGYRAYHVTRLSTGQDGGVEPESYYLLPQDRPPAPQGPPRPPLDAQGFVAGMILGLGGAVLIVVGLGTVLAALWHLGG